MLILFLFYIIYNVFFSFILVHDYKLCFIGSPCSSRLRPTRVDRLGDSVYYVCMASETEIINVTTVSSFTAGTVHQQIHMFLTFLSLSWKWKHSYSYHSLSAWHNVVFINVAKVDAGCVRVVKLLQAWRHVNKRFSLYKQPKY